MIETRKCKMTKKEHELTLRNIDMHGCIWKQKLWSSICCFVCKPIVSQYNITVAYMKMSADINRNMWEARKAYMSFRYRSGL